MYENTMIREKQMSMAKTKGRRPSEKGELLPTPVDGICGKLNLQ